MQSPNRSELRWVVKFPVPCHACDKESLHVIAQIVRRDRLPCSYCGAMVDVKRDHLRAVVNELDEVLNRIGAAYKKL